jgi:hypothetical protein
MNAATIYNHGARKSGTDNYHTPKWFVDQLPTLLGKHYMDPCPGVLSDWTGATAKADYPRESGLQLSWSKENFLNPPFSDLLTWLKKAVYERDDHGANTLYFGKLDFRTEWGQYLAAETSLLYPTLGYVKYYDPSYIKRGSATFQSCAALITRDRNCTLVTDMLIRELFPNKFYFGPNCNGRI